MLHSIETKNYVAEFYVSTRKDGKGVKDSITGHPGEDYNLAPYNHQLDSLGNSYKLDSIRLFNKSDRFINGSTAVPIKTVIFAYDYSLCRGLPNTSGTSTGGTDGKLTLKSIWVRYGNSDRSMISPYQFNYSACNPSYDLAAKDRWGAHKPNNPAFTNAEYPFVDQNNTDSLNKWAGAWSLEQIKLPSGGAVKVSYEADDYGFVQEKRAMEMTMVGGIGSSMYYKAGSQLYLDKNTPNLYFYFKRSQTREKPSQNPQNLIRDNYLKDQTCIQYNFAVKLIGDMYEPIKGYADFDTSQIGICPNNTSYGYVKLKLVDPIGDAFLHPATYTAINVGRYSLPHLLFPGSDPDMNDFDNVLAGLQSSFGELVDIAENPVIRMVSQEQKARDINLSKSFVRLVSPGMKKSGGGQR